MPAEESKIFKRGADFNVTMLLPSWVTAGHFAGYTGSAQIRRLQDESVEGLISTIDFEWLDPEDARAFRLSKSDTQAWPVGLAELDVMFTGPEDQKIVSETVMIKIVRNITRGS
jgi:hypothetical protein